MVVSRQFSVKKVRKVREVFLKVRKFASVLKFEMPRSESKVEKDFEYIRHLLTTSLEEIRRNTQAIRRNPQKHPINTQKYPSKNTPSKNTLVHFRYTYNFASAFVHFLTLITDNYYGYARISLPIRLNLTLPISFHTSHTFAGRASNDQYTMNACPLMSLISTGPHDRLSLL